MSTIREAQHAAGYRVSLLLDDGRSGIVDLEPYLDGPVFELLRDPARFAEVRFDPEARTIVWPNGADLAPEFLVRLLVGGDPSIEAHAAEP